MQASSSNQSAAELTRQGIQAVRVGDLPQARALLAQALRLDPGNELAWLWLSGAVVGDADRRHCLERVLQINPANVEARRGIEALNNRVAPAATEGVPEAEAMALPELPAVPVVPEAEAVNALATESLAPQAQAEAPEVLVPSRRGWLVPVIAAVLIGVLLLGGIGSLLAVQWLSSPSNPGETPIEQVAAPPLEREQSAPDSASSAISVSAQRVTVEFPDRLTFDARVAVADSAAIEQVTLEYGVDKLTCGEVVAKAFPAFDAGSSSAVSWIWEMRQSGSEPPGATIWYRWRVRDTLGNQHLTELQRVTWLDDRHAWQEVSRDQVTIHWYEGSQDFAEQLLASASQAVAGLGATTGVTPQAPINLYIYGSTADMRDAILYEPGWTGGQAFPEHDIVIIGVGPDNLDWGKRTVAHELTHILVGHRTFSCIGSVPTWLNEGIAVYGEGGLEQSSAAQLEAALDANQLISVRALSGNFSEHPDRADLSYAQSYSLVNYLIESAGKQQLLALFDTLAQGSEAEDALQQIYGFGLDGLEDRWRESISAAPRVAETTAATPVPIATPVPTYVPVTR